MSSWTVSIQVQSYSMRTNDVRWKVPMDVENGRFAIVLVQAKFYCAGNGNGINSKMLREEVDKAATSLAVSIAENRAKYEVIWFVFVATNLGTLPVLQIDSSTPEQKNEHLEAVRQSAKCHDFGVSVWSDNQLSAFFGEQCFEKLRSHAH